ncbi:FAD-dependent oxidoreductase [Fusibacter sp. Q10-2]|uniref:Urocanate reductase n=2 Tax=Fusibacter ferrireducens TaxID=2785058 RepID=A0ABR9ZQ94_9FIRM|nr:FAD-dependent oxidoreductase [Fusibacter ferrireducens]
MKTNLKKMLSILLCLTMVLSVSACQKSETASKYKAGTYTATANGKNGPIEVEVVFTADKIESVKVNGENETEGISEGALEIIPEKIVSGQTLAVDAVSGASLSSEAILKAVEDCVVQAGGDVEALKVKTEVAAAVPTEEVNYDIVVVGAGAAGTAAALAASEYSQSVLLLEKTAKPMGAGTLAGGLFAAESDLQKAAGKTVSKEWLYDEYVTSSSGYMNSLLVRKIIDESSETVNWLIQNGCKLNLVDAGSGASYEHIGMPATLHGYAEGGAVAVSKLVESFKGNGGTVMFSTPATDLIKDADGKIIGVMAKKEDGTELKINAKAVVLATGGFGGNEEMLRKYLGANFSFGEVSSNLGDGIKMAWDAGADELGIGTTQYFWQTFSPEVFGSLISTLGDDWFSLTAFSFYPHLRVNNFGQRFSDETTVSDFAIHGAQIHMQPQQTEFLILDSSVLNQIATKGYVSVEDHYGIWKDNRQFYMEFNEPNDTDTLIEKEKTPTDYVPLLDAAVGSGAVYKGDTLEELAKNMNVDYETFSNSVAQYNHAIESGKDELFFSDVTRLVPVVSGPYYAVKYSARNLTTLGGVKINEKIQAVDENFMPIQGLYVAGADAGGMYGLSYVDFEGGTLGFAYTSGRLAGINAAEFVNGK